MDAVPPEHPIRLVVHDDDLRRSRLTVFFRLLLALPHLVWLTLWGLAASLVSFGLWLAVLIAGKAPSSLHDFVAGWLRYATHVSAYVSLAANPFPGFRGRPGYPVDVEIDPPQRQSRWTALIRLLLAVPATLLAAVLGGGFAWSPGTSMYAALFFFASAAAVAAFLAWFATLALGREPRGLRDLTAYALGYGAQTGGYGLLLTGRYPNSDPALAESYAELPEHPVRIVVDDELARSRLTVLFRLLLTTPHFIWLYLWTAVALLAAVAAWFAALVIGRVPSPLHRFLAAYVRYAIHVVAYLYLVGRRFPGFTGRPGSYGIDVATPVPVRQSRWKTLFRFFLALPAFLLGGALASVAFVVAFLGWWYALVTGRMPEGLRNLGASCLRYSAQTYAYLYLVTDRYPHASPLLEPRRAEPASPFGPAGAASPAPATTQPGRQGTDILAVLIVCALVAGAAALGVVGVRSLEEPRTAVLRVLAPPSGCWSVALPPEEEGLGTTFQHGCGTASFELGLDPLRETHISKRPPGATYDLGATLEVDGELVRTVTPAPHWGIPVHYDEGLPAKTIMVQVDAPEDGCWAAIIDDVAKSGCGPLTFPLEVEGSVAMFFERRGQSQIAIALVADGRVVQTVGPTTNQYPWFSVAYSVPRESG